MPKTALGKATIMPKGAYSALTEYARLNLVTDSGNAYLYINATASTGTALSTGTHWLKVAEKGADGAAGANGGYVDYVEVTESANAFGCDVDSATGAAFFFTIADAGAKVVTFSNVPTGRCEVFLEITTSALGSVTWTLSSGSSVAWANGSAPILASGKVYRILFFTSDSGVTWDAFASVGV